MRTLECSVVIDVAMTETARQADYVLPATSQYEKAEATFFNFEFPDNYFHIRKPIFKAPEGPLDEGEIHMRLVQAMDIVPEGIEEELKDILSTTGRAGFRQAVLTKLAENPSLGRFAAVLLYRTLGPALPDGMQNAAALWAVCHQYAATNDGQIQALGLSAESDALGDALFDHLLGANSGAVVSTETWPDVWTRVPGRKVELALPELLLDAANLNFEQPEETSTEFPFLLSAGERRAFTANTIIRNPDWRRKDRDGALYINPKDAARLNLGEGSTAIVSTDTGSLEVSVELNERMQQGHISLPNGAGLDYPDENGALHQAGVSPNELTSASLRDAYVGTPWHKSVPAQLEAID
jgi:anaerobic selenocysteine-containing dehydrogenase